jgi:hypothetical protein
VYVFPPRLSESLSGIIALILKEHSLTRAFLTWREDPKHRRSSAVDLVLSRWAGGGAVKQSKNFNRRCTPMNADALVRQAMSRVPVKHRYCREDLIIHEMFPDRR